MLRYFNYVKSEYEFICNFKTKLIIHYSVLRIPVVETVVVVAAVVVAETKEIKILHINNKKWSGISCYYTENSYVVKINEKALK